MTFTNEEINRQAEYINVLQYRVYHLIDESVGINNKLDKASTELEKQKAHLNYMKNNKDIK